MIVQIKGTAVLDAIKAIKERAGTGEFERIVGHLDEETQKVFQGEIFPSSWYPFDAFARFLEADIRETAGGNEEELIKRSEAVIERQLRGIYKIFIRLASPEFVISRVDAVHCTYLKDLDIIAEMKQQSSAAIQYVGFAREH